MAFLRKSIPLSELAAATTDADRQKHGTTYSPSQGGWVRRPEPPTPGAGTGTGGRLRPTTHTTR